MLPEITPYRRGRWFVLVNAALLLFLSMGAAKKAGKSPPGIRPTALTIRLKAGEKVAYDTDLKSRQGVPLYMVRVDPDFAVGGKLVTWTLGLFRITPEGVGAENLLAPTRSWHGLQAFHFNALDLTRPADKGFGRARIFRLRHFTLVAVVEAFELVPSRDAFANMTLYIEAK